MLTGGQFYDLLCAVVPLYIALFLGYASLKWWSVLTPEQSAGIGRLNSLVAMPALIFQIIAFNNPYTMNNGLIYAYCLSNIIILGKYALINLPNF
jgi:auxin efflux carrier family